MENERPLRGETNQPRWSESAPKRIRKKKAATKDGNESDEYADGDEGGSNDGASDGVR